MIKDQRRAPLLEAMRAYARDGAIGYHTPGHKQGKGMHEAFREMVTPKGLAMEVSLMDELDDLHEPHSCIKDAQDLAADIYGADASFFFVNGTTGAIHAMVLAAAGPGEKIILPRNAHRSVTGGVMLSGAQPVYIMPEMDGELGIAMGVTPEAVLAAVRQNPDAKAVLLVYPTYYGAASDIETIARIVHDYNLLLLVDEAHGAHLKFHATLPISAMEADADLVAQSTHKLLGAMTQASMLHARKGRIDLEKVRSMASLVQSTSPNYLLMASLDIARVQMAESGEALLARTIRLADWVRQEINAIDGLNCFGAEKVGRPGLFALDPTKLTVSFRGLGITGAEACRLLREKYKIQAELSDMMNVLFILSIGDGESEAAHLVKSLKGLADDCRGKYTSRQLPLASLPNLPAMALAPRAALFAEKEAVAFESASGRVCAEVITFYPPGIPLICPGEILDEAIIAYCRAMQEVGLKVVGPGDAQLKLIKVVK